MAWPGRDDGKGVVLIYATCPSQETAIEIGRACVSAKLAACVNVLAPVVSVFSWEGETQTETECSLVAKTRSDCVADLTAFITARHPYDVPAVVAVPVIGGHAPFLEWVFETAKPTALTETQTKSSAETS